MTVAHECHVMHIDDNPRDLELLQLALEDVGIALKSYQGVTDPVVGVRLLTDEQPTPVSLVILDLNMPVMNGFEVLTRVRGTKGLANLPVIIFSTSKNPTDRDTCLRLGATAVIVKPASFVELREVAKRLITYC